MPKPNKYGFLYLMKIKYHKYHALKNDFIVIEKENIRISTNRLPDLALSICNRRSGVGADGIALLSTGKETEYKLDIYNSDGSWAEKSGNGLRIVGLHLFLKNKKRNITIESGNDQALVKLLKRDCDIYFLKTEIGKPLFETESVPVKSKQKYLINSPIEIEGLDFPVTCLSVGNPHTVLLVDNFDFDWKTLGSDIENHKLFPNRTNVEFVKVVSRKKLKVADWERGAGATGSSGTGASAVVAACVMLGVADRKCEVVFENGSLFVDYTENDIIELTGPVEKVSEGEYEFK